MKIITTTLLLFTIFNSLLIAQYLRHGILPKYANGLIYNNKTIQKLREIVDSLNYQFNQNKEESSFMSYAYAQAQYIKINAQKVESRNEIFTDKIPFEEVIKKYPILAINKNAWIYKETDAKEHHKTEFKGFVSKSWHSYPTDKWVLIGKGNCENSDETECGKNGWKVIKKGFLNDSESLF